MNIGIITVHDSANFGSFLQAYAMKLALEDLGHNVKFIKTRSDRKVKKVFMGSIKDYNTFFRNFFYNNAKYYEFKKDFNRNPEILLKNVNEDTFDIVIIGSDELWNVNTPVFRKKHFYGDKILTDRKIAYAISCGNANKDDMAKYPKILDLIKKIDRIYVRDENTKCIMKDLLNIDCEMVCDPTFLVDVDRLQVSYINPIKEKYILIYTYYLQEEMIEKIKRFAQEKKLKLVSVCMKQDWCEYNINCSPLEFSQVIKDAEYVVTTTFHGTIFSILNEKKFISIPASCKVNDLLKKLELSDRIINKEDSYKKIEKKINEEIDFKKCREKIIEMRKKSINKLIEIIK